MEPNEQQQDPTASGPIGIPGSPDDAPAAVAQAAEAPAAPAAPGYGGSWIPGPPAAPTSLPQRWLTPGPYLPRRDWQRKTRTAITAITGVSGVMWLIGVIALIAIGLVVTFVMRISPFEGKGLVMASCSSASTGDGTIAAGSPVVAWTDKTDKVLHGTLQALKSVKVADEKDPTVKVRRCYLPFTLKGVRPDAAGYNVRIGDGAPQFVTTRSLKTGAVIALVPTVPGSPG
ncbi:hypothetical protein HUN08_07720 [Gordonia sp. X0973]|uniref:hypothetical protein n=1 Tax=Gordonia sp. X0973 TaxID=2742602 RepID=UPI000F5357F6|nr:hypothetical protein [Gordonia sp. X0973]QKT07100.1 hypothetical protein HUN08_07720 [Gordonia sp. X0973]